MKNKITLLFIFAWAIAFVSLTSCKKVFEHSPYSSELAKGYDKITTEVNVNKMKAAGKGESHVFKVAILSDSHYHFNDLEAAINAINKRSDIAFTVLAGDMSEQGLEKEYMLLYDQLVRLEKPVFTVIGNHDYLANAATIYKKMFGEYNYSFTYGNYSFIFFDSNFWEKNGTPDFTWLENELSSTQTAQSIIISHIPPFGDQYDPNSTERHKSIISKFNVPLSIHGHVHSYSYTEHYNDGTKYLVVPSIDKRELCIASFEDGSIRITKEKF